MIQLIDELTQNNWYLVAGLLVLLLLWQVSQRKLGERPLNKQFPRLIAGVDLLALPFLFIIGGSLVRVINRIFGFVEIDANLRALTILLAYLSAGWALARFIDVSLEFRAHQKLGGRVSKLIRRLIYGVFLFVGLVLFTWQQGYSLSGIWVSTGVLTAVVGLALQTTLADFFSGIALSIESPLQFGDWVELEDGTLGEVVEQTWRAVYLRDWDNTTHVIPNSRILGKKFRNLHADKHRYSPWFFVKIPADVNPHLATTLLLDAAMRCESVLKSPNPVVRLADASSVPYSYMVWVHVENYPTIFRAREELFREIHRVLQWSGVEVAPQVQELRTRRARISSGQPPNALLALRSLDFAKIMTEEEQEVLAAHSEYRYHDSGQTLLAEGASSDAFYVVAVGLVNALVRLSDGSSSVVETLGAGKYFGITAMLTPDPSYLDYVAETHVTLIRIDLEAVRQVIGKRPELVERLSKVVKKRLDASEAARMRSRLPSPSRRLTLKDVRQYLLDLRKPKQRST
jgi:small-conductance mechanosensitive channel/CRP-like cAMP-binding protein